MFEVQNIYVGSPAPRRKRPLNRERLCTIPLVDIRQRVPREVTDVSNLPPPPSPPPKSASIYQTRSASGTMKTDIANSHFYSKFGILPIYDSTESLEKKSPGGSASIKVKKMTRIYDGSTKFPKLEECAHFHYDFVELGPIKVYILDDEQENIYKSGNTEVADRFFYLRVSSNEKLWSIRRTYENFRLFDKQLHRCIFDRKFSQLPELRKNEIKDDNIPAMKKLLGLYLNRFSTIAGSMINCGPILSWLEMDNRGNHLIVTDDSAINTPAVAAAHVVRRYTAQAADEISFEVGDIISIIDMPPAEETIWWRGKRGFEVGFFPSDCVEVIGDKVPQSMASKIPETPQKPVLRKRGKLISFLRMFFSNRPTRTTLKRTGIVKERVFGCDLGEHLLNSGHDVPIVLKCCTEVIEMQGIVDGIYRLSGVASNIQKLRLEFDEDRIPELTAECYLQDIHSISSLLKMYFRELPNPLFTYQLYDKFAEAIQDEENKMMKIHDVVQQLPPPHYRTAEYLIRHLARVATYGRKTGMHSKNLAIVWAPNLLRSKELETSCNAAALQGVGIQAIVTEFLIMYVDLIFSDKMPSFNGGAQPGSPKRVRPKSLAISTPTKLLSLEEARERALSNSTSSPKQKYIDVGGGPNSLPAKYHTVIDLPHKSGFAYRKKHGRKGHKVPITSGWRSLFSRSRAHSWKAKQQAKPPPTVAALRMSQKKDQALTEEDLAQRRKLRTVKSADSLVSLSNPSSGRVSEADSITIANPYAAEQETAGRPSISSTMSEIVRGNRAEMLQIPAQRSVSYDYSYSESEMDTDMSPSESVFFVEAVVEKSGGTSRGAEQLNTSLREYCLDGQRDLELQDTASDTESAITYHGSLQRDYGEMVPIVTRSHSMGMYDEVYNRSPQGPTMSTFGRYMSSEPNSLENPEDSEYEYVSINSSGVPRSRSMGHDTSPSASQICSNVLTTPHYEKERSKSAGASPVRSPSSIKERLVQALSPKSLHKRMHDECEMAGSLEHVPAHSEEPIYANQAIINPHFIEKENSPGVDAQLSTPPSGEISRETVAHRTHVKPLSPIGEALPVELTESPHSHRKLISKLSQEYEEIEMSGSEGAWCEMASMENLADMSETFRTSQMLTDSESEQKLHGSRKSSSPAEDHARKSQSRTQLKQLISEESTEEGIVEPLQDPDREINVDKMMASAECLSEMSDSEKVQQTSGVASGGTSPGSSGSPTDPVKALRMPTDLQRSMEDLDSQGEMGSIGSFSELSKSLNSLLNDVGSSQGSYRSSSNAPSDKIKGCSNSSSNRASLLLTDSGSVSSGRPHSGTTHSSSVQYDSSSSMDSDVQAVEVYAESLSPRSPQPGKLPSWSQLEESSSASDSARLEHSCDTVKTATHTLFESQSGATADQDGEGSLDGFSERCESDLNSDDETEVLHLPFEEEDPHVPKMDVSMMDDIPVTAIMGVEKDDSLIILATNTKSEEMLPEMTASMESTKSPSRSSMDGATESDENIMGSPMSVTMDTKKESPDRMVLGNSQEDLGCRDSDTFQKTHPVSIEMGRKDSPPHAGGKSISPLVSPIGDIDSIVTKRLWKPRNIQHLDNMGLYPSTDKDENENGVQCLEQDTMTRSNRAAAGRGLMSPRMTVSAHEALSEIAEEDSINKHARSLSAGADVLGKKSEEEEDIFSEENSYNIMMNPTKPRRSTSRDISPSSPTGTETQGVKRDSIARDSLGSQNDLEEGAPHLPTDGTTEGLNKDTPAAKRKRSVRELLSKFEVLSQSPPKESPPQPEIKFKPLVFQKPKIVHLKTLSPTKTENPLFSSTFQKSDLAIDSSQVKSKQLAVQKESDSEKRRERSPDSKMYISTSQNARSPRSPDPPKLPDPPKSQDPPKSHEPPKPNEPRSPDSKSTGSKPLERKGLYFKSPESRSYDNKPVTKSEGKSPPERTVILIAQKSDVSKPESGLQSQETLNIVSDDHQRDSSEEREGSVRQLSQMFERRNSVRSNTSSERGRSAERGLGKDSVNTSFIEEMDSEEKENMATDSPTKEEMECSVRKLSEMFERQNSSQSTDSGQKSLERSVGMDYEVIGSRPHSAGSTGSQGRGSNADKSWTTIL